LLKSLIEEEIEALAMVPSFSAIIGKRETEYGGLGGCMTTMDLVYHAGVYVGYVEVMKDFR
jgi:hypothetical protein